MSTMSEIPKTKFIGLLVSVFTFVCPFLLSYPFFMLYLIFSLPYILEILSFLSPVFVTAFILFTAFLPNLTNKISEQSPRNQFHPFCTIFLPKFLLYAYDAILEIFLPTIDNGDEEFYPVEVLELYKTVFETFTTDESENHDVGNSEERPEEKIVQAVESSVLMILRNNEQECIRSKDETITSSSKYDFLDDGELERPKSVIKETTFQEFNIDCKEVDKSFDKQKTVAEMVKPESIIKMHSRRQSARTNTDFTEDGRGRMSVKEKEWKKTLACKLLEDKHSNNVEDCEGEGMDLLWETHEEESVETSINEMNNENEGSEGKTIGYYEDEEDEEEIDIQVCCLHAFKFSSRKMSMGVGGRNLARFSKVVKGIRWLRSVTKHGNKMNNNQDKFQIHR